MVTPPITGPRRLIVRFETARLRGSVCIALLSDMSTNLQTTPKRDCDGTVLISMKDGKVQEVISDLQLDVQVFDAESENGGYTGFPSRPLWEYVRKATNALLSR